MSERIYKRVELEDLSDDQRPKGIDPGDAPSGDSGTPLGKETAASFPEVRWWILPLSVALCIIQAVFTITACNVDRQYLTVTMLAVLAFGTLFAAVMLLNPAMGLARLMFTADGKTIGKWVGSLVGILLGILALSVLLHDRFFVAVQEWFWPIIAIPPAVLLIFAVIGLLLRPLVKSSESRQRRLMRKFTRSELVCVFAAMMVTSGISTFGLTEQLVPLVATPWNPEWNTPQRGWDEELLPRLNPNLYITDEQTVRTFREGVTLDSEGNSITRPIEDASTTEWWGYYGQVFRAVPWGHWIPPLMWWGVFIFGCYGVFYSLTYVVLGYWSDREKLIFPLAKLPESLLPDPGVQDAWLPPIFKASGFWMGFLISFLVLTYNTAYSAEWISGDGISKVALGMPGRGVTKIVTGTFLDGLSGSALGFLVIFTAIGIAFLLPLEISFSSWFYVLAGKLLLLIGVWMGFAKNMKDFPSDWLWVNNPVTALGGGGLFCFSAISLFKCLREYGKIFKDQKMSTRQRVWAAMPMIGLIVSMGVLTAWVQMNLRYAAEIEGLGNWVWTLVWAFIFVATATLLTLGFMRIVAEGGIYWFQSHGSFFHLYKAFGLGKFLSPVFIVPLLPIYSVMFLDIKTFMAPSLLNAAKMERDAPKGRNMFHITVITSLVVTVVVAVGYAIFLAHMRGAQQMNSWFYSSGPLYYMGIAQRAVTDQPEVNTTIATWFVIGAVWVAVTLFIRRTVFWFPHAIGFIMLANPLMDYIWFSIFIGWFCKSLVVRYGGKATFDKVRVFFIGLIIGELIAMFLWPVLGNLYEFSVSITLNRYGA